MADEYDFVKLVHVEITELAETIDKRLKRLEDALESGFQRIQDRMTKYETQIERLENTLEKIQDGRQFSSFSTAKNSIPDDLSEEIETRFGFRMKESISGLDRTKSESKADMVVGLLDSMHLKLNSKDLKKMYRKEQSHSVDGTRYSARTNMLGLKGSFSASGKLSSRFVINTAINSKINISTSDLHRFNSESATSRSDNPTGTQHRNSTASL